MPDTRPTRRRLLTWLICSLSVLLSLSILTVATAQTLRERMQKRMDTNGDGQVSAEERAAAMQRLRAAIGQAQPEAIPATIDANTTALYKAKPGPHALRVIDSYTLNAPGRERAIPLRITIPQGQGRQPLLIFCHGALGSKDAYQPLVNHWASHGYIVIQPTFGDSLTEMAADDKASIRSVAQVLSSDHVMSQWDDRPQEVIAILDHLDAIANANAPLADRIDRNCIAVAGHSYGAHTSMMLLGMELFAPGRDEGIVIDDPRLKAAVIISPQGPGKSLRDQSFAGLDRPALFITGDNDGSPMRGQENLAGPWRRAAYDNAPEGDCYLLWLNDAHHGFGGITGATWPGAGPQSPDQVLLIQSTGLALLDAYVRDDANAKAYLQSDTVTQEADKVAKLERK